MSLSGLIMVLARMTRFRLASTSLGTQLVVAGIPMVGTFPRFLLATLPPMITSLIESLSTDSANAITRRPKRVSLIVKHVMVMVGIHNTLIK